MALTPLNAFVEAILDASDPVPRSLNRRHSRSRGRANRSGLPRGLTPQRETSRRAPANPPTTVSTDMRKPGPADLLPRTTPVNGPPPDSRVGQEPGQIGTDRKSVPAISRARASVPDHLSPLHETSPCPGCGAPTMYRGSAHHTTRRWSAGSGLVSAWRVDRERALVV